VAALQAREAGKQMGASSPQPLQLPPSTPPGPTTTAQAPVPAPFGLAPLRLQHPPPAPVSVTTPAPPSPRPRSSMATAGVVIITCCRADYLQRTLTSVFANMDGHTPTVYVSQDKQQSDVTKVIEQWKASHGIVHLNHPPPDLSDVPPNEGRTYHLIARHVGWAIGQLFDVYHHTKTIILEDDMEVAPDFFSYMDATSTLLTEDPTLYCVSAWNDNGQRGRVYDSEALYRSDFFPGLGWMLNSDLWAEIGTAFSASPCLA
jgi:hypothetical protein